VRRLLIGFGLTGRLDLSLACLVVAGAPLLGTAAITLTLPALRRFRSPRETVETA